MIVPSSLTTMNQANQLTQLCFSHLKKFTTMAKKNHQKCRQTKNNYQTQTIGLTRFVLSALFQYFSSSTQKKHISRGTRIFLSSNCSPLPFISQCSQSTDVYLQYTCYTQRRKTWRKLGMGYEIWGGVDQGSTKAEIIFLRSSSFSLIAFCNLDTSVNDLI